MVQLLVRVVAIYKSNGFNFFPPKKNILFDYIFPFQQFIFNFSVVAVVSGRDVDIVRSIEVVATARNDVVTARRTDAAVGDVVRSGIVRNTTAKPSTGTVKVKTDSPKQQAAARVTLEDLKNIEELVKTVVQGDNLASAVR